jgi:hypothetical protein
VATGAGRGGNEHIGTCHDLFDLTDKVAIINGSSRVIKAVLEGIAG